MSAPDTNVERQADEHKPSLLGIRGAMIFGALMIVLMIAFTAFRGTTPSEETLIGSETETSTQGADGVAIDPVAPGTNESN
ncbi:hypothetical protein Z946_3516 [Sulfitobacter noctilucicola]|uniref:Uncharacterized protein n=1 Tax=Sulfitobacter noctilucicola TaxID=1342301 RepID=A0A7W6M877_9RHOB|nr:hypothetical protein [Sulfitobacter noctilucicola]KIN64624.1 hypothetical protein Z946_3516 [Sulfitobacter noctilucicola]MBB4174225.1 hypothetical protein [Sulfitobacter noctilucicola]